MERDKVSTSEAMVDNAQQTSRGEIVSAKKKNEVNEDNSLTHFTFSVLFVYYKREEVEIRHEPSWYDKEELTDGEAGDQFGSSVAISGDTAVIGAQLNR